MRLACEHAYHACLVLLFNFGSLVSPRPFQPWPIFIKDGGGWLTCDAKIHTWYMALKRFLPAWSQPSRALLRHGANACDTDSPLTHHASRSSASASLPA